MFKKKSEANYLVFIYGEACYVDKSTCLLIDKLKRELRDTKHELASANGELKAIKPAFESKELHPALSESCGECKFVAVSRWSGDVIGCRKNQLCSYFLPKPCKEEKNDA